MYIPSQEQFQVVIDNLEMANKLASKLGEKNVDMTECKIFSNCDSPMCHVGWYAIATNSENLRFAAKAIGKDLGFEDYHYLRKWAEENSEIWGNENGNLMFYSSIAFNNDSDMFSLQTIINHWKSVKERALHFEPLEA